MSLSSKKTEKRIKNCKIGLEAEFFTLDYDGNVIPAADRLIKRVREQYPHIDFKIECAKNMVELCSFPGVDVKDTTDKLLKECEEILHCAEREKIVLFPLGTYPGRFMPEMRQDKKYHIKEQIFGKQRFSIAGRCVGFHCHYTLPWGVFDSVNVFIKQLIQSRNIRTMVNSYNLMIAMDPVTTTFMQSSPFYQRNYLGKDTRVIAYRGGRIFNYPQGLYAQYPDFGALQKYEHTSFDLVDFIKRKYTQWKEMLQKIGVNLRTLTTHGSMLDTAWNPVRINSNGTLEQRGADMNHPMMMTAMITMIKYLMQEVKDSDLSIEPSEVGITQPFKQEGHVVYIPPDAHVRKVLQPLAAFEGLENSETYRNCKGLLTLCRNLTPKHERPLLKPFQKMIEERTTVSDEIIASAKKRGFEAKKGRTLPTELAREIALDHADRLFKEIILTRKMLQSC